MVKFILFAQFPVDHLAHPIVYCLIPSLRKFTAFAYYVIDRFISITTLSTSAILLRPVYSCFDIVLMALFYADNLMWSSLKVLWRQIYTNIQHLPWYLRRPLQHLRLYSLHQTFHSFTWLSRLFWVFFFMVLSAPVLMCMILNFSQLPGEVWSFTFYHSPSYSLSRSLAQPSRSYSESLFLPINNYQIQSYCFDKVVSLYVKTPGYFQGQFPVNVDTIT